MSQDKDPIQVKYCSTQLDLGKRTSKEALQKSNHPVNECWVNGLYDNYKQALLRTEKKRNLITRATILVVLGRTDEDIKDGLTIEGVLPFFEKYKLKLHVQAIFYKLIRKHNPEAPDFTHRRLYGVIDGDDEYALNRDLGNLAQKSNSDKYRVVANNNLYMPEKTGNKSNRIVIEHVDDLLAILRNEPENDMEKDTLVHMIHRADNLEADVWHLYDAGFWPQHKLRRWEAELGEPHRGLVHLCHQKPTDDPLGSRRKMEVQSAAVVNRVHDAKTDSHYQLFMSAHKSYCGAQAAENLDEGRHVANVGWLRKIMRKGLPIDRGSLGEIDLSKAYTGSCMRIRAAVVRKELDIWQLHQAKQRFKSLSLYLVVAASRDLFFNMRYNPCYGYFRLHLRKLPAIKAVKHPSVVNRGEIQSTH